MKIILVLAVHTLSLTIFQYAEAKEISPIDCELGPLLQNYFNLIESKEISTTYVNKMLSVNDLWSKIKNSIATAWNSIKDIANKTKEKINLWIQEIKKHAEEVAKVFQAKLEVLKDKLNKFIQAIGNTAGDVKQCIQQDNDTIQELLMQIAITVANCIANSVKKATALESYQSRLALDETGFVKEAEDKINECVKNLDEADECLNKVRGEVYDEMEHTENGILETRSTSRNLAEDALETILACAADGVIDASEAITEEVLKIINCVISEKEKPFVLNQLVNYLIKNGLVES